MSDLEVTKTCTRCNKSKRVTEFYIRRKTGRPFPHCKECQHIIRRKWYTENTEQEKLRMQEWGRQNADKHRKIKSKWQTRNRKRHNAQSAEWRQRNPEYGTSYQSFRRAAVLAVTVDAPKAIRSFYSMVKRAKRIKCRWCGKLVRKSDRHVDHVVPLSRGGAHGVSNFCCSCSRCNLRKNNKLPHEFSGQHELFSSTKPN